MNSVGHVRAVLAGLSDVQAAMLKGDHPVLYEALLTLSSGCHEESLASYIIMFMRKRNGGELDEAISEISWASHERMVGELAMILQFGGRPPNWTSP